MKELLGLFVLCALTGFIAYSCGRDSNRSGYYDVHGKYKEINEALHQRDSCALALIDSAIYYFDDEQRRDYVQQCLDDVQYLIEEDDILYDLEEFDGLLYDSWFRGS